MPKKSSKFQGTSILTDEQKHSRVTHNYQLLLTIILVVCSRLCLAQVTNLKFENLSVREGLSGDVVTSIMQDSQGFMWFGTFQGVSKYDGHEFTNYLYEDGNPHSLQSNMISCLLEDHAGKIWVGSSANGLSVYNRSNDQFENHYADGNDSSIITDYSIRVLMEDSDNFLWIGTEDGLSVVSPDRKTFNKYFCDNDESCQNSINGKMVYDLVEDTQKRVWIATENKKLCVFDKNSQSFTEVNYTDLSLLDKDDNILKNLYFQNDSILWVASINGGVSQLNINTLNHKTYYPHPGKNNMSSWQVRDMVVVENELWLATDGAGLDILNLDTEEFTNYKNSGILPGTLSKDALWTLYKDPQGIIWIGTFQGGVNKFDPRNNYFKLITNDPSTTNSIPNKPVLSLFETQDKTIWVGTDWGGLHGLQIDGKVKHYVHNGVGRHLSSDVVKAIGTDNQGNLLLGSYNEGMNRFNPEKETFQQFRRKQEHLPNLFSNNVWAIYTDSRDITWVATLGGGISIFNKEKGNFSRPDADYEGKGLDHLYHIYEDSQSNLWFSTDGGVLYYQRRTDTWNKFILNELYGTNDHEINQVRAVYEDNLRNIWMATAAGLLKYVPGKEEYSLYGPESGLPELPLLNITDDTFGNLILVSRTHISQFDLSKEIVTGFQINDNSFTYNSLLKRSDGQILIGGTKGISYFNPRVLRMNEFIPPVYITEFTIFNQPQRASFGETVLTNTISETESIDLKYEQSVIGFKFAALNYTETQRNQYAYMMEGFDKDWNYVGSRRMATYTNLDPGTYTFKVKASNNHGIWNEEGTSVRLIIHPPFWKTNWFKALVIFLVTAILILIQRFRIKQIRNKYEYERLQSEKEVTRLKNENLKKKLESTRSELDNITMSYLHKNQKLQHVRQRINETINNGMDKRKLTLIVRDIDKETQDHEYWDKFEHQFNQSHDNFLERFKHTYPDLSKRELRVCAYLRMGLDNQEIATLMNVTVRTVETSRYRIRKKINLEERQSFTKMILRF